MYVYALCAYSRGSGAAGGGLLLLTAVCFACVCHTRLKPAHSEEKRK